MTDSVVRPDSLRRRRARVARIRGAIAVLIALAVVGGGIGFVVVKGKSALAGMLDQQRDYQGTGTGTVTVTIAKRVQPDRHRSRAHQGRRRVQRGRVRPRRR